MVALKQIFQYQFKYYPKNGILGGYLGDSSRCIRLTRNKSNQNHQIISYSNKSGCGIIGQAKKSQLIWECENTM